MKERHRRQAMISPSRRPWGKERKPRSPLAEDGFILVGTLVTLLLLIVIGITATTTSTIEVQIAGNDKLRKLAFFGADGGADVGARVLEENAACSNGFTANNGSSRVIDSVQVTDLDFWKNTSAAKPTSIAAAAAHYPAGALDTAPHTRITAGGPTALTSGAGLQMGAGYEGKGKGTAGGGAHIEYDIFAQRIEANNSQSTVNLQWWHVVGLVGDCKY